MRFHVLNALLLCSAVSAVASDPALTVITPRGVQRGAEHVLTFSGARLQDAEEILFYEPGFEVVKIEPDAKNANIVRATVKVAPDVELGEKTAQVRTKTGVSDYRTFFVGALPAVAEKEPNTEFSEPQAIEQGVTVEGVIQNEDVDYFVVEAKKGQRLSVEVEGMRFGQTLFDPYIAILDKERFELSAVDDSPLVRQDAVTSIIVPEDGQYTIEMRESGYGGNGNCRYRLHVGQFPRPVAVFPAGGQAGEEVEFTFIGDAEGPIKQKVKLPADGTTEMQIFAQDDRGISPSGHTVRVSPDPDAFETEPNNSLNEAAVVVFPSTFNGVLDKEGDHDYYKFTAKKGQTYEVECYGRRIRTGIDPVMHIFRVKDGKALSGNDDSRGPDSYIRFAVPEDGEYAVRIMDHLNRGGADFVYRVEFQPVEPKLTLGIPRVRRYSQDRQRIYVAKGNRFGTIISASRANFGGELVLEDLELPAGINMVASPMPSNLNTMPVMFEAAADAPLGGALVDFRARLNDESKNISGGFENRADFVIAQPGQSLYAWKDVNRLPVVVVDELPYTIEIVQPKVPIVRNGSMQLKVVATKKEGWDEEIVVQFPFRPPGLGATTSVKMPKGKNEVLYPLSANANAAIGKWPVYALAYANVGGNAFAASQMATLEIAEPYLNLALQRATVELGQETEIVAEVSILKDLAAPATVQLLGLPHKITAEPLQVTKDTKELIFHVKTAPDSPAGNHKNIFCSVVVTENNEPITHARVGGTELRVDKPLPKPVVAAPKKEVAKPKPEAPKPPAEKRLTRLEKLRLEAKQAAGTP
ncbi:PPC domain-containing protein [Fuerstiella marisgermanici]|uniref:Putative subtilase-type serine protease n=1 Tax=Fuerstiella marisgermanici TaxID=1891926 RepID=A0A1P8WIX8_9PLAN|nr:PPC domain-containing protein [Fuerstiella marisgermanici]APZ93997.1 putative subtilase-type serine protease precursor [Fuerstiella marisgermanici]